MSNENNGFCLKARFHVWFNNREDADVAIEAAQALEYASRTDLYLLYSSHEHCSPKEMIMQKCLGEIADSIGIKKQELSFYFDCFKALKVTRHKAGLQVDMSFSNEEGNQVPNPALAFAKAIESTFILGNPISFDVLKMNYEDSIFESESFIISNGRFYSINSAQLRMKMIESIEPIAQPDKSSSHVIHNGRLVEISAKEISDYMAEGKSQMP